MSNNKIAVIQTGGKQYKVAKGDKIKIEKLDNPAGETVHFETLLSALSDGTELDLGKPFTKEKVEGKILEHGRKDKISVVKFKRKVRYKKNVGHRQAFSLVEIVNI